MYYKYILLFLIYPKHKLKMNEHPFLALWETRVTGTNKVWRANKDGKL